MDAELLLMAFQAVSVDFTLKTVNDGTEVLAYLSGEGKYSDRAQSTRLPSLLLLDMRMPRMDGFQVLAWLQSQRDFRKLPVIVIGASMSSASMKRACKCGARSVLSKMNDFKEFMEELKRLIDSYLPVSSSHNAERVE